MEKEIKINCPEGYTIDKENSTFECIKFKPIEKELPKTWEGFCKTHPRKVGEGYIKGNSTCCVINTTVGCTRSTVEDRNILPSKELAEAMLALCQLIQLRDCYNDGWVPDWTDELTAKYCISIQSGEPKLNMNFTYQKILAFKTKELHDQFLENFRDLIEIAKPLL